MKKINGYLVVRFNDREKRENPELGNYGVIDAELYSGNIALDLGEMEYSDAESIEEAVEQARGLNSEFDVEEPKVQVTIVKDADGVTSEERYDPARMFSITQSLLAGDILNGRGEDIDPRTAAHELRGFAQALMTMGAVSGEDERFYVPLSCFEGIHAAPRQAADAADAPEPEGRLSYICDELCKHRAGGLTQAELDALCEKCKVGQWPRDPPGMKLRTTISGTEDLQQLRRLLCEFQDYLGEKSGECQTADNLEDAPPPRRNCFLHLPVEYRGARDAPDVYRLGLMLEEDSPANDCVIYRNIFRMAKELDSAMDVLDGYAAQVIQRELGRSFRELREMYQRNYAVRKYLEGLDTGELLKKKGPSDKQTAPGGETVDELSRAETALERAVKIIQGAIAGEEQREMLSDLSTLGRLLEKEQSTPTATELEKIEYLARGLIAGSIHLVAMPMEPDMISAEFIDTVRRKLAARFIFERMFGSYCIKFAELFPL